MKKQEEFPPAEVTVDGHRYVIHEVYEAVSLEQKLTFKTIRNFVGELCELYSDHPNFFYLFSPVLEVIENRGAEENEDE